MSKRAKETSRFEALVGLVARLRAPDGCPWDRVQTHASLKGALLEEACEVMVEIEQGDAAGLQDELGDLLLHVVFHAQIAEEAGEFDIEGVIGAVADKLVRRHPHVFGDELARTPEEVKQTWERVKKAEGGGKVKISDHLPALVAARKLQERASNARQPLPLDVDVSALEPWLDGPLDAQSAIGRLLFAAVALAREHGVEPEWALAKTLADIQRNA